MPRPERSPQPIDRIHSAIQIQEREKRSQPTHIVEARFPEGNPNLRTFRYVDDQSLLGDVLTDSANFPGGHTPGMYEFFSGSGAVEVSHVLQQYASEEPKDGEHKGVVAIGAQTSLTGAAVPKGEVVLNMSHRNEISEVTENNGEYFVTVQSGVSFQALQERLHPLGLSFPSAPTYALAKVGGAVSTDAGGARSEKYGKTRKNVEALTLVLASGEVIDMKRGQYLAHPKNETSPGDYFELITQGETRRIPVPTYTMPDVPKISAGYFAKSSKDGDRHGMDLIDLVIGSEGTLGVITDVTLRVIPEPPTAIALVSCASDEQALGLMAQLREQEPEKRLTGEPGGISAMEYIGERSLTLVREHGSALLPEGVTIPKGAKSLLLVQIETPDSVDPKGLDSTSMRQFDATCEALGIMDFDYAAPQDDDTKEAFIAIRESVPLTVNDQIQLKQAKNPKITKVGADPCVRPEDIGKLMKIYEEEYAKAGVNWYPWGHGIAGNIHANVLPDSEDELIRAKAATREINRRVIEELDGTATAEHGNGKNPEKQRSLRIRYKEKGIEEMREVKRAFDPHGIMAPGNIFESPAA